MNRQTKNLGYVLNFAGIIMFIAMLGIVLSNKNISYESGAVFLGLFAIIQFFLSFIIMKELKLELSSKWFFGIGFVSLLMIFPVLSRSDLLSEFFEKEGAIYIYLSIISIFVGIFSIIVSYVYKNIEFIKVTYVSFFVLISLMFKYYNVDMFYIIIALSVLVFFLNIFAYKKSIYTVSKLFTFIIPCIMIVLFENMSVINALIFIVITLANIIIVMSRNKDMETSLLSLLLIFGSLFLFDMILFNKVNYDISLPIITSIHLLVILIIEYFEFVKKNILVDSYKIVNYIYLIGVTAILINHTMYAYLVSSVLILISMIANKILFKDDKFNTYALPVGIMFIIITALSFISKNYISISYNLGLFIVNIALILLYRFNKDYGLKIVYSILIAAILTNLVLLPTNTILNFILNLGVILVDYVFVTLFDDKKNSLIDYMLYAFLVILPIVQINDLPVNHIKYLILGFLYMILLYKNSHDRIKSAFSVVTLLVVLSLYIDGVISVPWLYELIVVTISIIGIYLFSYLVIPSDNEKRLFNIIVTDVVLTDLLAYRSVMYVDIYILVIALVMILYSIKREDNKLYLASGLIYAFVGLASMLSSLSNIPLFMYLFLVGFVLMISVIFLIKDESKRNQYKMNYCPNCGKKVEDNDKFCANCGENLDEK
ncbi:unknown [Firmicutes bacterium CAG:582]|nr:unknown [Firmicutes bacterium CAG:582]